MDLFPLPPVHRTLFLLVFLLTGCSPVRSTLFPEPTATLPPAVKSPLQEALAGDWLITGDGPWAGKVMAFGEEGRVALVGSDPESDMHGAYVFTSEDKVALQLPEGGGKAEITFENDNRVTLTVTHNDNSTETVYSADRIGLSPPPEAPSANSAIDIFEDSGCQGCHNLKGAGATTQLGPPLDAIVADVQARLADPAYSGEAETPAAYIIESITHPGRYLVAGYEDVMPPYRDFSQEELDTLVELLLSPTGTDTESSD